MRIIKEKLNNFAIMIERFLDNKLFKVIFLSSLTILSIILFKPIHNIYFMMLENTTVENSLLSDLVEIFCTINMYGVFAYWSVLLSAIVVLLGMVIRAFHNSFPFRNYLLYSLIVSITISTVLALSINLTGDQFSLIATIIPFILAIVLIKQKNAYIEIVDAMNKILTGNRDNNNESEND